MRTLAHRRSPLLFPLFAALLGAACADPADLASATPADEELAASPEPTSDLATAIDVTLPAGPAVRTPDDWLHTAAQDAEAVLVGTVVAIEYGASAPDSQGFTTPHTWVTWKVERALKGIREGATFTGRFIGGPNAERTGMLQVSGMPQFDLGDRDVLFVTHNGEWACPLVGGAHGRLRVIGDAVYTDDGRPLLLDTHGGVGLGRPVDLPEVRTTTIAGRTFHIHGDASPAAEGPTVTPAARADVLDVLTRIVADFPASREVRSADPAEVFVLEMLTPGAHTPRSED